ncbi:MAG: pmtA, partial [candidate division NC10 bacterium]|nr:pmtA [candidate division NC10 bacterium]
MRALEYKQIKRAYAVMSPMYDLLFDKIFHPGRVAAVQLLGVKPND